MKRLLFLFILLASVALAATPDAIGSLYTRDITGSLNFTCTASVVDGESLGVETEVVVMTAAHCVDRSIEFDESTETYRSTADYRVTFNDNEYYAVELLRVGYQTKGFDVATLVFTSVTPDVEPLAVGSWRNITSGTAVINYANPMGLGLQRFEGYVTMLTLDRPVATASLNWRGNAVAILPSAGGSSGSLVLDSRGAVIGVLIGYIGDGRGAKFTVFVPHSKFDAFLNRESAARDIEYQ